MSIESFQLQLKIFNLHFYFNDDIIDSIKEGDFTSLNKAAMKYSDGVVMGSETLNDELKKSFDDCSGLKMEYESEEVQPKLMSEFFDKVIEEEAIVQ